MKWMNKLFGIPVSESPVEKVIEKLPENVDEVYKARWVWYHTILAGEIFLTNILLIALIIVVALK
jgi:hypothetical protein